MPMPSMPEGRRRQPRVPDFRAGAGGKLGAVRADQTYATASKRDQASCATEAIYFGFGSVTKSLLSFFQVMTL